MERQQSQAIHSQEISFDHYYFDDSIIFSPNVLPSSVETLSIISKSDVVLLVGHTRYTLFSDVAIGTKSSTLCLFLPLALPCCLCSSP